MKERDAELVQRIRIRRGLRAEPSAPSDRSGSGSGHVQTISRAGGVTRGGGRVHFVRTLPHVRRTRRITHNAYHIRHIAVHTVQSQSHSLYAYSHSLQPINDKTIQKSTRSGNSIPSSGPVLAVSAAAVREAAVTALFSLDEIVLLVQI